MEDNINDALGLTEKPKKKFKIFDEEPASDDNSGNDNAATKNQPGDNSAESILMFCSYVILILGILGSITMGVKIGSGYDGDTGLGWGYFLVGTLSSILGWAFLMVIANISLNIRQIKHNLNSK
jgi:hypothetical protein